MQRGIRKRREIARVGLEIYESHRSRISCVAVPRLVDARIEPAALAQEVTEHARAQRTYLQRPTTVSPRQHVCLRARQRTVALQCTARGAQRRGTLRVLDKLVRVADRTGRDHGGHRKRLATV